MNHANQTVSCAEIACKSEKQCAEGAERWKALKAGIANRGANSPSTKKRQEYYGSYYPHRAELYDPVTGRLYRIPIFCTDSKTYDLSTIDHIELKLTAPAYPYFLGKRQPDPCRLDYDWLYFSKLLESDAFKADFLLLTDHLPAEAIDPCDPTIYQEENWHQAWMRHKNTGTESERLAALGVMQCREKGPAKNDACQARYEDLWSAEIKCRLSGDWSGLLQAPRHPY